MSSKGPQRSTVIVALLVAATVAIMVAVHLAMRNVEYETGGALLVVTAWVIALTPLASFFGTRGCVWALAVAVWGFWLGAMNCDDMGANGYFLEAGWLGFVCLATICHCIFILSILWIFKNWNRRKTKGLGLSRLDDRRGEGAGPGESRPGRS